MKKTKLLLRTDFRSSPRKLIKISRFITLFALVGAISFFQSKVNAQDMSVNNTGPLAVFTNVSTNNNADAEMQQRRITGTIKDENGDPLAGATVQVVGTTFGTLTGSDGTYSIDVPDEKASLMISFVGYISQQVPVAGKTTIDITLSSTLASLEEVIVVGYSTMKRASITGAVSVVKGDAVAKIPVANVTNALAGQISGVITRQNGGEPPAGMTLKSMSGVLPLPDQVFPLSLLTV